VKAPVEAREIELCQVGEDDKANIEERHVRSPVLYVRALHGCCTVQVFRKDSLIKRFPDIRPLPRWPLYNIDQLTVSGAGLIAEFVGGVRVSKLA
jgi:hypothetical protein